MWATRAIKHTIKLDRRQSASVIPFFRHVNRWDIWQREQQIYIKLKKLSLHLFTQCVCMYSCTNWAFSGLFQALRLQVKRANYTVIFSFSRSRPLRGLERESDQLRGLERESDQETRRADWRQFSISSCPPLLARFPTTRGHEIG